MVLFCSDKKRLFPVAAELEFLFFFVGYLGYKEERKYAALCL